MTKSIQVLIVEDRPADAELMVAHLTRAGFQVEWQRVELEQEVRHRITANLDIVLTDYTLPTILAPAVIRIVKEMRQDVPVIVVSGSVGDERAVEVLHQGAVDYILKDRMARLGPAVERALGDRARLEHAKQAERALRSSEERMRGVLGTIEDVVASVSLTDNRILYLNPAAEQLTGRPMEALLNDPQLWADCVHAEDRASMAAARQEAIQWGAYQGHCRMVRPDGSVRDVAVRAWTAYDNDGKPSRLEAIWTDVTAKRQAEAERAIREASEEEGRRLSRLNEFKSRFIGMVAHDLNNLVTPLALNSHILTGASSLTPRQSEALVRITHSAKRFEAFLADLLDASRLQSGQLEVRIAPMDLAEHLRLAGESIKPQADAAGMQLKVQVPSMLMVLADAHRLGQVTANLLSNALKFTPDGGRIDIEAAAVEGNAEVRVRDTGCGLSPEDIGKLFQPFTKVGSPAPQKRHTGTGLGLFICKGILEQMGGSIRCESPGLGQGTTFIIRMPPALA